MRKGVNDMTREQWIELLKGSVEEFNHYRKEHPEEIPDLREVNLSKANLHGADLSEANLWGANLREADLREADLSETTLCVADFSEANLWGAKGLSQEGVKEYIGELKKSLGLEEVPQKS